MRYVFFLCNVLDDITRNQRGIFTDSPAASKKIMELCTAIQGKGTRCFIISLGRGKSGGLVKFFSGSVRTINSVPIIYAPYTTIPFFSELFSLLAPLAFIFRFRSRSIKSIVFYNPIPAYLPALFISTLLRFRRILDLEDGNVAVHKRKFLSGSRVFVERLFDYFCNGGALLACDYLAQFTSLRPTLTYYGVVNSRQVPCVNRFKAEHVRVLFSGTLEHETGAQLLIDTIVAMRAYPSDWSQKVIFEVTGKGTSLNSFIELAKHDQFPKVIVHGRTTNFEYQKILNRVDIGLSLKLSDGPYANTTFPSKVMEFASNGILVLTTNISDVHKVFGDEGALYLLNSVENLKELIRGSVQDRIQMARIAKDGHRRVMNVGATGEVKKRLTQFIFEGT